MAGAWPVWVGRGCVETCVCEDVFEGGERGLLVWSEVVEVACGNVWIDDLDPGGVVCVGRGEEGRHVRRGSCWERTSGGRASSGPLRSARAGRVSIASSSK